MSLGIEIVLISTLIGFIGSFLTKYLGYKEKNKSQPKAIEKELKNLESVSDSLNGLQKFIEGQKNSLIENEKTIIELEKRREELKPIVETQQQTVEAILKAHSSNQKKSKYFDYLMGFFIGIASSGIVTLIFFYFQNGQ